MKKILLLLIPITILYVVSTTAVEAQSVAGQSATIVTDARPTSAELRIKTAIVQKILDAQNSPLAAEAEYFVTVAEKYQLDAYLLPSIAWLESSLGKRIKEGTYNPFGWGSGHIAWQSYQEGIEVVARSLRMRYYNRGARTIHDIGKIYAASPTWSVRVDKFMNVFYNEEAKVKNAQYLL